MSENIGMIKAECHSDDRNIEIEFNAALWFKQASAKAIQELATCGWGGDYTADEVAIFMADHNTQIADMFKYLHAIRNDWMKKDCHGFECHVNEESALAWLAKQRPEVKIQSEA